MTGRMPCSCTTRPHVLEIAAAADCDRSKRSLTHEHGHKVQTAPNRPRTKARSPWQVRSRERIAGSYLCPVSSRGCGNNLDDRLTMSVRVLAANLRFESKRSQPRSSGPCDSILRRPDAVRLHRAPTRIPRSALALQFVGGCEVPEELSRRFAFPAR
jgi:hypothetical protein